ncbi:hypothetical protein TSAR_014088 [Trichomalopsis sarcophagae]|uniref:Uncharacterized protein n=1 Tax=Trichomalopsis sarcophagae TaxID=543379 RepID=A0A232FMX0_9HYME|nr:hypothetical protein TSAR_014088 [Trichomalopsis sarcophagae]
MNSNSQQEMLATAQALSDQGKYDEALVCVASMTCIMGEWMRGKIYFDKAEKMANGFLYKNYATEEMESAYLELLEVAYRHLLNASKLMANCTQAIKDQLNDSDIWGLIYKLDDKITVMHNRRQDKKNEDEVDSDYQDAEDDKSYYQHRAHSLAEEISYWNLNMETE